MSNPLQNRIHHTYISWTLELFNHLTLEVHSCSGGQYRQEMCYRTKNSACLFVGIETISLTIRQNVSSFVPWYWFSTERREWFYSALIMRFVEFYSSAFIMWVIKKRKCFQNFRVESVSKSSFYQKSDVVCMCVI